MPEPKVSGRLETVVLETAEPERLAGFYARVLGWPVTRMDGDWVEIADGDIRLSFQQALGHEPPRWPDPASSMQFHLDVEVADIAAAEPEVLAMGARRLSAGPEGTGGDGFRVYTDPAGHPFCLVRAERVDPPGTGALGRLGTVVVEARDPAALAGFYSTLLGVPVTFDGGDWVDVGDTLPQRLSFQQAPGHEPPRWPDPASSMQFHLDIEVADVEAAEVQVLAAGARRLPGGSAEEVARGEREPDGTGFRVYADPAGHPFCLVWG
jgi:predicted enzyme related to lactoylglutathione lyase